MLTVLGLLGTAGAAVAITTAYVDEAGAFHGCVANKTGNLRVVTPGTNCKSGEAPIEWNETGPQGEPGVTNVADVYSTMGHATAEPGGYGQVWAYCLPGDQVISGGYNQSAFGRDGVIIVASYPEMQYDAWHIFYENPTAETHTVSAAVVCQDL